MYINNVTIYSDYHTYSVWDGNNIFINVDESQIIGVVDDRLAGFRVEF
jgi:hypothetical protein